MPSVLFQHQCQLPWACAAGAISAAMSAATAIANSKRFKRSLLLWIEWADQPTVLVLCSVCSMNETPKVCKWLASSTARKRVAPSIERAAESGRCHARGWLLRAVETI